MVGFLAYTLEAGVIFAVLTVIYRHVYYGISYNRWERGYLLAATVASYLLPLLKIEYEVAPLPKPSDRIVEIVERGSGYDVVTLSRPGDEPGFMDGFWQSSFFETLITILMVVYLIGVSAKLVSFLRGLFKTLRLMRRSRVVRSIDGVDIREVDVNTIAFSFFGNIFLGTKSQGLSDADMDVIIRHEMQHIKGCHSLDTLVMGLYSVLQWYNPMVRLASRYSRIVCENIADQQSVEDGRLTEYSQLVLRLGIKNRDAAVVKSRRSSTLVDRIAQLLNHDGVNIRRIRFVAALPVLAIAIAAYIALFGMLFPSDPRYAVPVQGGYTVVAGFFNEQKVCTIDGDVYVVSHKLMNIQLESEANIVAPVEAEVVDVGVDCIKLRIDSCTVTIEGIVPMVERGAVSEGQLLGRQAGEIPISLSVADNGGRMIDPQTVFRF